MLNYLFNIIQNFLQNKNHYQDIKQHSIMISGEFTKQMLTILNIYVPNNRASKYMTKNW
jgi:hypothetical protein